MWSVLVLLKYVLTLTSIVPIKNDKIICGLELYSESNVDTMLDI